MHATAKPYDRGDRHNFLCNSDVLKLKGQLNLQEVCSGRFTA